MDTLEKKKIVEHNDLIASTAKMDRLPLKIFELAVAYIDTKNPPKDNTVVLSKKVVFNILNMKGHSRNVNLRQAIRNLHHQAYFEFQKGAGINKQIKSISPISSVTWTDYGDDIRIEFNKDIMPYLVDLKANFTQYALTDVALLSSKHSITIYKWLNMKYNQYHYYENKNTRSLSQLEELSRPTISITELRRLTDTCSQYNTPEGSFRFNNFNIRVLKHAIDEINLKTSFEVEYSKIIQGRKVIGLQFDIKLKSKNRNINYYPKIFNKIKKTPENLKNNKGPILETALNHKYTKLLINYLILPTSLLRDEDLVLNLYKKIYPRYSQFIETFGYSLFLNYLIFLQEKVPSVYKSNLEMIDYLEKSLDNFQNTLTLETNADKELELDRLLEEIAYLEARSERF